MIPIVSGFLYAALTVPQLCFGGDQLDQVPCCTPVDLALPQLPPISLPGQGICWDDCNVAAQTCLRIDIAPPVPGPDCGRFVTPMEVSDCSGVSLLKGDAVLDYTRTWCEERVPGQEFQVWRFAFKVDLFGDHTATPTCPVPTCLGPVQSSFFYGYLDYARDCASGAFEQALVLFHGCDEFMHDPLFSSQPGSFHPTESYAIVAPDTSANPFVPSLVPPQGGTLVAEAMRSTDSPVPFACLAEEPIQQGDLVPLGQVCLCPLSPVPPQQGASRLVGTGACGGFFGSINAWPTTPWYELITHGIGRWTTGASYPGPEQVATAEGLFLYTDTCSATGVVQQSIDVFYGAETTGGWTVVSTPVQFLTDRFLDLASNYSSPFPGGVSFPLLGNVNPTTPHLIYANTL